MNKFIVNELNNYFPFEIEDLYSFITPLSNKSESLEGMSKFLEETMNIKLIFQEKNNYH